MAILSPTINSFYYVDYRNGGAGNSGQYVYGSTVVMSMDSTGNLTAASNITAYGAP